MRAGTTLLVATPGGHIDELYELAPRLAEVGTHRIWVTAQTAQTEHLLGDEEVVWVPGVGSRQGLRALSSIPAAMAAMRTHRPRLIVSTGAALSVPYLWSARVHGIPTHYIESATRLHGPSITGRVMERTLGVVKHHQGFVASRSGWNDLGSVFDGYGSAPQTHRSAGNVVVTVGTERFPFQRILTSVASALPSTVDVVWQTGHTPSTELPGTVRAWIPHNELQAAVERADIVVTHAGVGSVLMALRCGRHPLILPRRAALGEHVDDHQVELARHLEQRGLATVASPDDDLAELILESTRYRTVHAEGAPLHLNVRTPD